jgi:hypothetical protein
MEWVSNGAAHDLSKTTKLTMKKRHIPNTPTARHKLNSAYVAGSLVIAGAVGLLTRSPTLFLLTAGTLLALSVHSGDIRLKGGR